ncbi:MAG: RidA family protein [bacterium]|nr:RidA family protein [bacterium]
MKRDEKLKELQINLPEVQAVGNYLPAVRTGKLLFISGQIPRVEGRLPYKGKLGAAINLESGRRAARACVVNAIAVMKKELGDLDRIKQIVRMTGYVASAPGFNDQPKVLDGGSELLVELFGEAGRHSRAAVGVAELPLDVAVEIEMIVEIT